ncbi:hypothetical protein [Pseudorhodoferax sp. Leaf265]|uniref:hypothetical protein n=1 Tax=Pseudorhodoferax sp. Leaf265 TaxID=1736315 RepID=UPI00070191B0|nr:hypothetical protein [Pseudorhodoferax sp. Leaf265]KQP17041.1 hypothetical protein ASF45_27880 [Pseudorhodoferax sp. Leaf265]
MSDHSKVHDLVARYPYMFEVEELAVYAGWIDPIQALCEEIHAQLEAGAWTFHFLQIKEKFGACRIYFSLGLRPTEPGTDVARQNLAHLKEHIGHRVEAAELECSSRCIVCGLGATPQRHGAEVAPPLCQQHEWSQGQPNPREIAPIPIPGPAGSLAGGSAAQHKQVPSSRNPGFTSDSEVELTRATMVREGLLIEPERLARSWGESVEALAQACKRKELFLLRVGGRDFYPAVFASLSKDEVHRINLELRGDDDAGKLIFWYRTHGGVRGQNLSQALRRGMVDRVLELALAWSEERGLVAIRSPKS